MSNKKTKKAKLVTGLSGPASGHLLNLVVTKKGVIYMSNSNNSKK